MDSKYTVKQYTFGDTVVRYTIMNDSQKVFMNLLPVGTPDVNDNYARYELDFQFMDHYDWYPGALGHIQLSHHSKAPSCSSCKYTQSYKDLVFKSQDELKNGDVTTIKTVLSSDEGYELIHSLSYKEGDMAFTVATEFRNISNRDFKLEMISSATLDGLSPYSDTEHSKELNIHIFQSGWATEGKHQVYSLSDLNLEKSWGGNYKNYKIGNQGARSTIDYFPFAAIEDKKQGVIWAMEPIVNGSWQMEFTRCGRDISFSCGIGDKKFANWSKIIKSGESFQAPPAYVTAVKGGIADASDRILRMRDADIDNYGEEGMPIIFNEWCTTWGKPTHEGNVEIAKQLVGSGVKYFVMDAGWNRDEETEQGNGDWIESKKRFPKGLKAYTDEIRSMGFIPGIWMEFECVDNRSKLFNSMPDGSFVKYDGVDLVAQCGLAGIEKMWDLRNPEVVAYLKEHVIDFLKDNGFGYLKVDYNSDMGMEIDGEESGAEELRKLVKGTADFFRLMKKEIPDLVIENCASGGMRLDPVMTGVTAMSSFSDAHECFEFPIVAANLHYLIPPCQSQIWCVLKPQHDENRFAFTISAGFLGRLCWSGDFAHLSAEQLEQTRMAERFYGEVSDIIRHGKSYVFRSNEKINFRYPEGTQAVVRYSDDGERAIVVYHTFENPDVLTVPLNGEWRIEKTLYDGAITAGNELVINESKQIFGNAVLLKRV